MAELKIVLSHKGKAKQIEAKDDVAQNLLGKKIGDKINGELFDLTGYEFEITGGSDEAGKPMRKDLEGPVRKRILAVSGVGFKKGEHGQRQRKLVAGNTIFEKSAQVNMKVVKEGSKPLFEEPSKGDDSTEPKSEEASKSEEKKE
ncbi:MAG: 30S ribosomal protein S6e [Candidatus Woesearchaeota archaeon]